MSAAVSRDVAQLHAGAAGLLYALAGLLGAVESGQGLDAAVEAGYAAIEEATGANDPASYPAVGDGDTFVPHTFKEPAWLAVL